MIFSSPHSGDHYPISFVEASCLSLTDLRQSEDYAVHHLFEACVPLGAPLLTARFPRVFCDANREAWELDPDMFEDPLPPFVNRHSPRVSAGLGTIPRIVSADVAIFDRKLSFAEAEHRITACHMPYHEALQRLIEKCRRQFGFALVIDCHSMPGNSGREMAEPPLSDFILGNRFGRTCPQEITDLVAATLQEKDHSVAFNSPYAGGYITRTYADLARNIYTLQIEINRDLYMDPKALSLIPGAQDLQEVLGFLLKRLGDYFQKSGQKYKTA
nr:N-formylglutamate amidohydrolase [Sneathiella limimaris]